MTFRSPGSRRSLVHAPQHLSHRPVRRVQSDRLELALHEKEPLIHQLDSKTAAAETGPKKQHDSFESATVTTGEAKQASSESSDKTQAQLERWLEKRPLDEELPEIPEAFRAPAGPITHESEKDPVHASPRKETPEQTEAKPRLQEESVRSAQEAARKAEKETERKAILEEWLAVPLQKKSQAILDKKEIWNAYNMLPEDSEADFRRWWGLRHANSRYKPNAFFPGKLFAARLEHKLEKQLEAGLHSRHYSIQNLPLEQNDGISSDVSNAIEVPPEYFALKSIADNPKKEEAALKAELKAQRPGLFKTISRIARQAFRARKDTSVESKKAGQLDPQIDPQKFWQSYKQDLRKHQEEEKIKKIDAENRKYFCEVFGIGNFDDHEAVEAAVSRMENTVRQNTKKAEAEHCIAKQRMNNASARAESSEIQDTSNVTDARARYFETKQAKKDAETNEARIQVTARALRRMMATSLAEPAQPKPHESPQGKLESEDQLQRKAQPQSLVDTPESSNARQRSGAIEETDLYPVPTGWQPLSASAEKSRESERFSIPLNEKFSDPSEEQALPGLKSSRPLKHDALIRLINEGPRKEEGKAPITLLEMAGAHKSSITPAKRDNAIRNRSSIPSIVGSESPIETSVPERVNYVPSDNASPSLKQAQALFRNIREERDQGRSIQDIAPVIDKNTMLFQEIRKEPDIAPRADKKPRWNLFNRFRRTEKPATTDDPATLVQYQWDKQQGRLKATTKTYPAITQQEIDDAKSRAGQAKRDSVRIDSQPNFDRHSSPQVKRWSGRHPKKTDTQLKDNPASNFQKDRQALQKQMTTEEDIASIATVSDSSLEGR